MVEFMDIIARGWDYLCLDFVKGLAQRHLAGSRKDLFGISKELVDVKFLMIFEVEVVVQAIID